MTFSPMLMAPGAYHLLVRGFHKGSNEIDTGKFDAIVDVDPLECLWEYIFIVSGEIDRRSNSTLHTL